MSSFSTGAADIGQGIGNFLNPIIGGTTKTTVTETPTASASSNSNTITIAIVVVVVLVVGYFLLKPKKAA